MPGLSFAQKDGTYTNKDGQVQRIRIVVDSKGNAKNDLDILTDIIYNISGKKLGGFDNILALLVKEIAFFNNIDMNSLTTGINSRKAAGRLW